MGNTFGKRSSVSCFAAVFAKKMWLNMAHGSIGNADSELFLVTLLAAQLYFFKKKNTQHIYPKTWVDLLGTWI